MTVQINLIGTQSAKYQRIKNAVVAYFQDKDLTLSLEETNYLQEIIRNDISGIPAIKYNNSTILFDNNKDINIGLSELYLLIDVTQAESSHHHDEDSCKSCSNCQCSNHTEHKTVNDKILEI